MKINLSGQNFDSAELYFCDKKQMDTYVMPGIYVEYRIDGDPVGLVGGSFDEVPENAVGAYITQKYPIINEEGNISFINARCNLYVGYRTEKNGVEGAVIGGYFREIEPEDKVFESLDGMKETLDRMFGAFKLINPTYPSLHKDSEISKTTGTK